MDVRLSASVLFARLPRRALSTPSLSQATNPSTICSPPNSPTQTCSGYGNWLHGEAVAAGTVMAADMSRRLGWIDESLLQRIVALNHRAGLPIAPPEVRACVRVTARGFWACWHARHHHHNNNTSNALTRPAGTHTNTTPCPPLRCAQQGMTVQQFRDTMAVDKKVQDGKLRLILLR